MARVPTIWLMPLELKAGDSYGEFRIHQVLRCYPHAWVYKVEAPGFSVPMDLKVSVEPVHSDDAARRALREIAVLGSLTNAHVVKVHDSGMGPGEHWYILMDHLEGAQLHHWHDFDVPLPAADSAGFIHQACLGLAEVHTAGVVHRDLNPQRLWVEPDRTLKIMDFSSARSWNSMATGDNVTVNTVVTGSPEYAAPEQMFASELTPAADVYSLGVVLYEMLSGHSPFFPAKSCSAARVDFAENPALWLRAHAQTAPTPLSEHPACAGVPAKLAELVLQTLAKEPGNRPENAGALANALGWILHHDLGAAQAGILRTLREGERARYHLVLPGSHRIGYGPGLEVSLDPEAESRAQAVIEWAGPPKSAELLPSDGATILLNGHPVSGRKPLGGGDHLRIGDYELAFTYPPGYG